MYTYLRCGKGFIDGTCEADSINRGLAKSGHMSLATLFDFKVLYYDLFSLGFCSCCKPADVSSRWSRGHMPSPCLSWKSCDTHVYRRSSCWQQLVETSHQFLLQQHSSRRHSYNSVCARVQQSDQTVRAIHCTERCCWVKSLHGVIPNCSGNQGDFNNIVRIY